MQLIFTLPTWRNSDVLVSFSSVSSGSTRLEPGLQTALGWKRPMLASRGRGEHLSHSFRQPNPAIKSKLAWLGWWDHTAVFVLDGGRWAKTLSLVCPVLSPLLAKIPNRRKRVHVRAKLLQSYLTLWDPMDCSPPGSSVHGILQARILEWAAISLLQGTFLTQGSSLCLLHWQVGTLPLVPPGKPIPVFTGVQRNQTATLSSFSHRLYCLNIFNYDFFGQTLIFTKPYIPCCWVTSLSMWYHIFMKRYFPQSQTAWFF